MVSVLDSGSSGLGSSLGLGHCVVFLGKILYSHIASLGPGVPNGYRRRTDEFNAGVTLRWTSIPSRGTRNILSLFVLQKPGKAPATLACMQTLPYLTFGMAYGLSKKLIFP